MKKLILIATLVLTLTGCAALKAGIQNGKDCWNDPVCRAEAAASAESAKNQITQVAGVVSPLPWVPTAAGCIGGGIAFLVMLSAKGAKKNEILKKENPQ